MNKKLINPPELFDGAVYGMSQATIETQSGLVFLSGQIDSQRQSETKQSVEGQMRKALANLTIALENAGSSIDKLLQVRIYIRGEFGEYLEALTPILANFFGESRPAMTGIGVASLASPEILVEVEAIAFC
ncbi:RidA family protein [Pleurocapsa sp. FMAR1]|uniref:RidA family protein n=1 Tax=Pleurocapsa sp. FMAR1 TaxID=3040204 RepID=UPI0029C67135|nr:RidA family protein [Pleurocapsa sp. FMAR1]